MHGDDASAESRISGRRSVDDGARLLIAENSLLRVEERVATLADGQDVINGVLIGRPQRDGTTSIGLAEQVRDIRAKQNESGEKIDAVIADMGDVKTAQADQAKTLAQHTTDLGEIKKWFATGVECLKKIALYFGRGIMCLVGIGALHLLTLWWPGVVNFFTTWAPAAAEASSKAVH